MIIHYTIKNADQTLGIPFGKIIKTYVTKAIPKLKHKGLAITETVVTCFY